MKSMEKILLIVAISIGVNSLVTKLFKREITKSFDKQLL